MSTMMQTGIFPLRSDNPSDITCSTRTFTQVNFLTPFPEGARVVVIPMVQTYNGEQTPGIRIAEVTRTGFKIRINELVRKKPGGAGSEALSDGFHNPEEVGYVAFSV